MPDLPDLGVPYRFDPATGDDESAGITLLLLHEAGQDESSLVDAARRIAPGAALLSPRGSLPEDGGFRHLPPPPVEDPDVVLDPDLPTPHALAVHARTPELAAFLAAASEALDIDAGTVWALGFGDGASAVTALFYDHPDVLEGAVVLSGREPFRPPRGRVLDHKQVFCATGRNDESVTLDDYEELVEGLVTAGADVELHWYDIGHELSDQELDDARAWLRKRLADS